MSQEAPEPHVRSRSVTLRLTLIVVILMSGALAFMLFATGKVGVVETTDAGITKYLSKTKPDAQLTIPITLQEGGDATHESEHIFEAFQGVAGIETVTVKPDGSALLITYAKSEISEADIRALAQESGYAQ
jgi:copper chaperone CopZ